MLETWQTAGFGVYVHWPFCQAKCPYCDFNSHVVANVDQKHWLAAYKSQIDRYAALTPGRTISSIFFGGGTPSMMDPATVDGILNHLRASWPVANDVEITLEANPTSVEAGRFSSYRQSGVNRVSLGVQSLRDQTLRQLGRLHSVAEARAAYDIARHEFSRVSFDLIYATQDQDLDDWRTELTEALAMGADHMSLYQLTIEPGTAFHQRRAAGGLKGLPDEDMSADMFDLTQDYCGSAGLPAYEVSNHARDGAEAKHNMLYWNAGDYLGIGPGAHGRITLGAERHATSELSAPFKWLKAVGSDGQKPETWQRLTPREQAEEYLMMGLRINEGISLARLGAKDPEIELNTQPLIEQGFLELSGDRLKTTEAGRPILNALLREILV
ncbi:hypothetical protein LCGC14_1958580 [marine sediment metagenome]|uniref:Radical SAM core domain-containing protein n=1 Tax=marine sediment metagenome TaxID=412755 RepID=A0A0F9FFI5_9ZZZZ